MCLDNRNLHKFAYQNDLDEMNESQWPVFSKEVSIVPWYKTMVYADFLYHRATFLVPFAESAHLIGFYKCTR